MPFTLSRRALLQSAAVLASVTALPALAQSAHPSPFSWPFGLLLPESPAGEAFLTGLQLALPDQPVQAEWVQPGRQAASLGIQRLLDAGYRQLVGLMGPNLVPYAAPRIEQAGATLLAVDTGANLMRADEESPNVATHSLGLWRGALAAGAWAVREYGPRVLVVAGMVESGYDMLHAFEIGVDEAGGTPLPAIVTHVPGAPLDWAAVLQRVNEARPDAVYALYSGDAAVEFLRAWQAAGLQVPLVASPFLVDEAVLPRHEGRAEGLPSVASWSPTLETPADERFVGALSAPPGVFTLLGYETGLLIEAWVPEAGTQRVEGPRGWVRPGPLGETVTPLYLRQVTGEVNRVVGALPAPDETAPALQALRTAVRTGWITPYLV